MVTLVGVLGIVSSVLSLIFLFKATPVEYYVKEGVGERKGRVAEFATRWLQAAARLVQSDTHTDMGEEKRQGNDDTEENSDFDHENRDIASKFGLRTMNQRQVEYTTVNTDDYSS